MGNKNSKTNINNDETKSQSKISLVLCQSCEETQLRLEFQNDYWNIRNHKYGLTDWKNNKTCRDINCSRHKN